MFVKVHKPVNTPCVCDNKDRCRALVEYLLKESLEDKPYMALGSSCLSSCSLRPQIMP